MIDECAIALLSVFLNTGTVDDHSRFPPFPEIVGLGDELHVSSVANRLATGELNPLVAEVMLFFGHFVKEELL